MSEPQEKLFKSIASKEGISDYDILLKSVSKRGEGYMGFISYVIIKDQNSPKELNFVLKTSIKNEKAREQLSNHLACAREVFVYEQVLKAYEDLQKGKNVKNPFKAYARYYGSSLEDSKECLILQNMNAFGYKLWSRKEPMNADHIAMVFIEYGKLHGVSLGLKWRKPEVFDLLKKNMVNIFAMSKSEEIMKRNNLIKFNRLANIFKDDEEIYSIIKKYGEEKSFKFKMTVFKDFDQFSVFTHGDCWTNNLLFKYEIGITSYKPIKMCFIDWQLSSYGSPILDLAYYFLTCCPTEIFPKYKTYLRIYHQSLSKILSELGCDPEKVITYDQCEEQWSKYCQFGLHISINVLKLMLSEPEEAFTFDEVAESGRNFQNALDFVGQNDEIYKKRMSGIIMFLHENGFLI